MSKYDFNSFEATLLKITLWHECSPVNLLRIFKIPFPNNT